MVGLVSRPDIPDEFGSFHWQQDTSCSSSRKASYLVQKTVQANAENSGGCRLPLVKSCTLHCVPLHFAYPRRPHRTSEGLHQLATALCSLYQLSPVGG